MIGYTPTPDYYNDYLCHYGVKGMKWHKRLAKKAREFKYKHFTKKKINSSRLADDLLNGKRTGEGKWNKSGTKFKITMNSKPKKSGKYDKEFLGSQYLEKLNREKNSRWNYRDREFNKEWNETEKRIKDAFKKKKR